MTNICDILEELNESNSSNYKLDVLRKYKDHELLQRVLKMAYDRVVYTYGVTNTQIEKFEPVEIEIPVNLEFVLASIECNLCSREYTGHAALQLASNLIGNLHCSRERDLVRKIINRDLRVNCGRSQINKVWKDLITKPPYMRCGVYNEKSAKKIKFPALVQLKADGTYRHVTVENGEVTFNSRSGEESFFPLLKEQFSHYPDGVYIGELLVDGITNRSESNGLINSDNVPHDRVMIHLWDYVTLDEWSRPKDKKNKAIYSERFGLLCDYVLGNEATNDNIQLIQSVLCNNISEALKLTHQWMNLGYEGSILKDVSGIFRDTTSPHQLKLKIEIDLDVRCVGFIEGKKGTKRELTFGSIIFSNDEGTIQGQTSGFSDAQLIDFNSRRKELVGKIMVVQCNDITKARDNAFYALSHPRFIEFRDDKAETDTLDRAFELKEMSMTLGKEQK